MIGVIVYGSGVLRSTPMVRKNKVLEIKPLEIKPLEIKSLEIKSLDLCKYPKRDNTCVQCGQQLHWCVCHLNDY